MRRLIAFILLVIGVTLLVGCVAAGFTAIRQPAELHSTGKAYFLANDYQKQTALPQPGLKRSGRLLVSLDSLGLRAASPHFLQRCLECHASFGDCALCHLEDAPVSGHTDLLSCASCHQPPTQAGQGNGAWRAVRIDHNNVALTDCQSCHASLTPENHFQAQCSTCHTSPATGEEGGWLNVRMDHQAAGLTDCQSCHAQRRPGNHFTGQCGACHNTSAWSGARFNHQGATNCQNCHNPPRNHYGNECKQCHTPVKAWTKPNFSWHKFDMDHGGADGNCSTCHTRNGTDCTSCHESEEGDDDDHDGGDDD